MRKKILLTSKTTILLCYFAIAQTNSVEVEKKLEITGSADVYYKYDFAKIRQNSLTSFTQTQNQFSLGMASVKFDYSFGKTKMVADLGFGQRAKEFTYTDEGIMQAVKQLYISYSVTDELKLTVGNWATHVGYELLDPQYNRNYSMSYMFSNGPFSHTGVKGEYNTGKHGLMLGVANATDYRFMPEDAINKKFLLAQYSYAPADALKIYLNYAGGQHIDTSKSKQFDLTGTVKISDHFWLGINTTYASVQLWDTVSHKNFSPKPWWGAALYFNYDPTEWFGLTLRSELFNDHNHLKSLGAAIAGDNILSNTLSANFKKGGFIFIPEIRWDHVNKKALFIDAHKNTTANAVNVLFAAVYSF